MKQHSCRASMSFLSRFLRPGVGSWVLWNSLFKRPSHSALVIVVLLSSFFASTVLAQSGKEVVDQAKAELMCVCGCPHQLGQCGDECGVAPKLIGDIQAMLDEGADQEEVYSEFEARYGAMIYAAPKAEGFNLIGWLLPFVGLLFGGLLVWGAARKLKVDSDSHVASSEIPSGESDEKYRKMLEKELSE